MSDSQWFVTNGEWRRGPLTLDGLVDELLQNDAPRQLLVWREGMSDWALAERVLEVAVRLPPAVTTGPAVAPQSRAPVLEAAAAAVDAYPRIPWFTVGTTKLVVMSVVTFGLYELYWFYQQWQRLRSATGEKVQPLGRAIFSVLYCHSLFKRIIESAQDAGLEPRASAGSLSTGFILLSISWRLPNPFWVIAFFSVLFLVPVQRLATAVAAAEGSAGDLNTRLTAANWIGVVAGAVFLVFAGIGTFAPQFSTEDPSSAAFLSKVAEQANKSLPKTLDSETELVQMMSLPGTLVYYYRLVNYTADQLNAQKLGDSLRPNLTKQACSNTQTRDGLLKHGVTLRHIYRDKNRQDVISIDIRPRDCGM